MADTESTAEMLAGLRQGEGEALNRLMPQVYDELHRIAHRELARRGGSATLPTIGLVHEAYLKLVDRTRIDVDDRAHFLALAATAMRHIVIDHARSRATQKRGGGWQRITLDDGALGGDDRWIQALEIDEALRRLQHLDERLRKVVECRFFGGMTVEETALAMGVGPRTVDRAWQRARAWLYREIHET